MASISPWTTCLLPQRWEIVREKLLRWKKDKKACIKFHTRRGAALIILDRFNHELDGNMVGLTNKELKVLLR